MIHELKILPIYFERVLSLQKKFEIRKNDRDYQIGDELILNEFNKELNSLTGRNVFCKVIYVLQNVDGLEKDYCLLGIDDINI